MVAVVGLHGLADLAHLQLGTGGDELGDQGAAAVHHGAGGQEGVTLGLIQLAGGLVPAVVALLVHSGVEGGGGIGSSGDLSIQGVGLRLGGRLLLIGGIGAVVVLGEGQQDVLAAVNALGIDHVPDVIIGGVQLAGLLQGLLQAGHQVVGVVQAQVALPADALLVQPLLGGQAIVGLIHSAHLVQLLLSLGPLILGDHDARLIGVVSHGGVQLADLQGLLLQIVGGGLALDLLLPGLVVGQIAGALSGGDAGQQPVQILVGGDLPAVHGEEHGVPAQAGGLIGDVVGSGGGLRLRRAATGHGPGQKRAAESGAQEFLPVHISFLLVVAGLFRRNRTSVHLFFSTGKKTGAAFIENSQTPPRYGVYR